MLKRLFDLLAPKKKEGTVVTFTGGMGNQILSAAVYFHIKEKGEVVYADLRYFDQKQRIATPGNKGEVSYWPWQLDYFGIMPSAFDTADEAIMSRAIVIKDGGKNNPDKGKKGDLALEALTNPGIAKLFDIRKDISDLIDSKLFDKFVCIHIRRGDYLNAGMHIIKDDDFLNIAFEFSRLVDNLVVISDSAIEPDNKTTLSQYFRNTLFFDDMDAFSAHRLMRAANVLICSNSQFSLSAATLNNNALIVLPTQWHEGKNRNIEYPIHNRCRFQIYGISHRI